MSVVNVLKCDQCGKTAKRDSREDHGWQTLGAMSFSGERKPAEPYVRQHFCSMTCLLDYVQPMVEARMATAESTPQAQG